MAEPPDAADEAQYFGLRGLELRLVSIGEQEPREPCPEELDRNPSAGGRLDVRGKQGQAVAWIDETSEYLVETFDGEYVRVAEAHLSEFQPQEATAEGGFDLAFPRSPFLEESFAEGLVGLLMHQRYCVIQMTSSAADRRAAFTAAEQSERWERPYAEFETAFMGRDAGGKKVLWLRGQHRLDELGEGADAGGLEVAEQLLGGITDLLLQASPHFGFSSSSRTNGMVQMGCSKDEEQELLEGESQRKLLVAKELDDCLAFCNRRKFCMMLFLYGSGGTLTLQPNDGEGAAVSLTCQENMLVVFRHDLMEYTFEPRGRQMALQAWILRDMREGESGLDVNIEAERLRDDLEHMPQGHLYPGSDETVDITALAARVQGDVWSPDNYWSLLAGATDTPNKVPHSRWDHDLYVDEGQPPAPGKGYIKHFGFLDQDQIATFDNEFFGLTDEEARRVDPVQRVAVEVGYDCLYRAGWTSKTLKNSELVYGAAYAGSEWVASARSGVYGGGPDEFKMVQNTPAACAVRMHYLFGMRGSTFTVETACSSSLTATAMVHTKLRPPTMGHLMASMHQQSKFGMAAGMNAYFDPFYSIGLCGASMLTHMGRCFTFDASADGFVRGEGFTTMHYKVSNGEDLSRLATLCGSMMNQDGRSASLTAPHGPSQQECIRHSLREAGIRSLDIQIQELHGTGTPLGDPIEIGALRATMMQFEGEVRDHPLIKTSSKSNIGHTELNAGNCGIMKCVLMGVYCASCPNVHLRLLNPHIDDNGYPVYFGSEFVDQGKDTGYHGVSSFGFGGSNARGDIWARAQGGWRNTQPGKPSLDFSRQRILVCGELYGQQCLPLPPDREITDARHLHLEDQEREGFRGQYLTGNPLDEEGVLYVRGSFNGWSSKEQMQWDDEKEVHTFAFHLGETRVEQFQILYEGQGHIFPATKMADEEALILGPGVAPPGHNWVVDGRDEEARAGTVYGISFKWDSDKRQKRITWMPTMDEEMLEIAASVAFEHKYHIVGSWTTWKPLELVPVKGEKGLYETTVRIGLTGHEEFNFQRDADKMQAIYPALKCRSRGKHTLIAPDSWSDGVPVRGPDHQGGGKFWMLAGDTGDHVQIQLFVQDGDIEVTIIDATQTRRWKNLHGADRKSYFVTGSINSWAFTPMNPDPSGNLDVYRAQVQIPRTGEEVFQIVVDEDSLQAIYPEMHLAEGGQSAALGPDAKGQGVHWAIFASAGSVVEITLDFSQSDRRQMVTWKAKGDSPLALES